MNRTERAVRRLAALLPAELDADPDLDRALATVGSSLGSHEVRAAALVVGVSGVVPAMLASLLFGRCGVLMGCVALALGAALGYGLRVAPDWLATAHRARALGGASEIVALAVLRARIAPTPEGTAAFAAEHGRGPLAASLRGHVDRARGAADAGWESFVATWDEHAGLARSVALLRAGVDAPESERDRLLDRAFSAALDGTRERSAAFAADARGPVGALYAFGVVLPLALVAALPAAQGAGVPLPPTALALGYDALLPLCLLVACAWVLARRPAAFPSAPVPASHPDLPAASRRALLAALAGVLAGALAVAASRTVLPGWTVATAPGATLGAALFFWFRPAYAVRKNTRELEDGLPDALAFVGRRLGRSDPPETALAAADGVGGPAGEALADAATVQRRLRVGLRDALVGEHGALAAVPSPRARAGAELLALAAAEGPHGGRVMVELADHLDGLRGVEAETRRELASTVSTLRNTACVFAPLIGGITVSLAARLASEAPGEFVEPVPTDALGAVVGGYVLLLAALLAGFAAALESGTDRARIGYHVGLALLAAAMVYPVAAAAAGVLL